MKKRILLVKSLMLCSLLFVSCDDDNEISCPEALTGELSTTEVNFVGTWNLKSIVAEDAVDLTDDDIDNASTDLFDQYTDCQKDIEYSFSDNRDYNFRAGLLATDCENTQNIEGTWALNENSELMIVFSCASQLVDIDVNDESTAFSTEGNFQYIDVNGNTVSTTTTFTYEKAL